MGWGGERNVERKTTRKRLNQFLFSFLFFFSSFLVPPAFVLAEVQNGYKPAAIRQEVRKLALMRRPMAGGRAGPAKSGLQKSTVGRPAAPLQATRFPLSWRGEVTAPSSRTQGWTA